MKPILPPVITLQPSSLSVASGGGVDFVAAADGTPPLIYQWLFNGQPISNATNLVLHFDTVSADRLELIPCW